MDRMDHIDWIVPAGSYWLDRIGIGLGFSRRNWLLCAGWFATGWMGRMNWISKTLTNVIFVERAQLVRNQIRIKVKYTCKLINACNSINANQQTKPVKS